MVRIRKALALLLSLGFAACAVAPSDAIPETRLSVSNPVLDRTGGRIAFEVAAVKDGVQRRSIVVATARSGAQTHELSAAAPAQLHSPAFGTDGQSLYFASVCLHTSCPATLFGNRIVRVDLASNRWTILTGPGAQEPFWTIGFQHLAPKLRPAQVKRTDPIARSDGNGVFYLMSTMTPHEISSARDFAVRRLTREGSDRFLSTDPSGTVGFRGPGSLASYGPDRLIVLAAARNGGRPRKDPKGKPYGFILNAATGAVETTLYRQDLKQAGIALRPDPTSLTGATDTAAAYFIAGDEVVALRDGTLRRLGKLGVIAGDARPSQLALSGDDSRIAVFGRKEFPDGVEIVYHAVDIRSGAVTAVSLDPQGSANTRRIEIR